MRSLTPIVCLSVSCSQTQRSPHAFYRHDLINQLQNNHALVTLVAENLSAYMEGMRQFAKGEEHGVSGWSLCLNCDSSGLSTALCYSSPMRELINVPVLINPLCTRVTEHSDYDPQTVRSYSRYSHVQEVQERLNFLRWFKPLVHLHCEHTDHSSSLADLHV